MVVVDRNMCVSCLLIYILGLSIVLKRVHFGVELTWDWVVPWGQLAGTTWFGDEVTVTPAERAPASSPCMPSQRDSVPECWVAATPVIVAFPFAACINPLMVTLKQQSNDPQTTIHQYGDWCPHAVNGWAVTFGTGRRAWMKYRQRWCTYFCYKQANKKETGRAQQQCFRSNTTWNYCSHLLWRPFVCIIDFKFVHYFLIQTVQLFIPEMTFKGHSRSSATSSFVRSPGFSISETGKADPCFCVTFGAIIKIRGVIYIYIYIFISPKKW